MTITSAVAIALLAASLETVEASDLKTLLKEVMPCRAAAVRLCDRSQGITHASLWTCGATLASQSHRVGVRCLEVLKRHGQL
jgi:hypothetical protein